MHLESTPLQDLWVVVLDKRGDERGWFARTYCKSTLAEHGIDMPVVQMSMSMSHRRGTIRGLHYQAAPHGEKKFVRCIQGALYDVAVDIRRNSPTFGNWFGIELSPEDGKAVLVPEGFAHGFQTLAPDTAMAYAMSHEYVPSAERGIRWDDPAFSVGWPLPVTTISQRDAAHRDFDIADALA